MCRAPLCSNSARVRNPHVTPAERTPAGGGRLHVHPRIAHVEHLAGGDARRSQYFADDRRIGFERHVGTLSQNHVEADVGEIAADELLGAGLELVRRNGQPHAPPLQLGQQFGNSLVRERMFVDMREIIRHEIAPHGVDRVGRAQCFGKCALHEPP